jgi:hypothetical protein
MISASKALASFSAWSKAFYPRTKPEPDPEGSNTTSQYHALDEQWNDSGHQNI